MNERVGVTHPPRLLTTRPPRVAGLTAIAVLAMVFDLAVWRIGRAPGAEEAEWYQALRQIGYLPTWITVGIVVWLLDRRAGRTPAHHRAGLIALSPALAGLLAAMLKPLCRRLRPEAADGLYAFRPIWEDTLSGSGIGLPSGHTATAFGGAVMVGLLWPAVRWPMWLLAAGCGVTRLLAGAHFLSDVVVAAMLGSAMAIALFRTGEGPRTGPAGGLRLRP